VNRLSRRTVASLPLAAIAGCAQRGWIADWDRELIERSVKAGDLRYDPKEHMLRVIIPPGYRYHTTLRDTQAHPTRDSLEYALSLLEEGSAPRVERARTILDRVLPLQVSDPDSKWYGIWGYYLEEPPEKMAPADWNWADFNGSYLLLIELRHGAKLVGTLRKQVRQAIAHAAESIRRRNVAMSYTNIAIMGTFVTMAAAELLGDSGLKDYARDRSLRLARQIDETGTFNEYNSPTYARVSLTSLTRYRMFVRDQETRGRMARIERRLWEHMAAHWDAARAQFAGPMSRCYSNDLGAPLWLEKSLDGRLALAQLSDRTGADAETAIHDYRCPQDLVDRFLTPRPGREHVELFTYERAGDARFPVQGTTWFDRDFSLGTVNRGDFWNQRRPLLAYYGDRSRPPRTVVMRVVKDGYDFSSALLFSVQKGPRVLGLVNFRNPGGDRHISLDPIQDGAFKCGRLFLELRVEGLEESYVLKEVQNGVVLASTHLSLGFKICRAVFGRHAPNLKVHKAPGNVTLTLDFKPQAKPDRVVWSEIKTAWAAFALELGGGGKLVELPAAEAALRDSSVEIVWGDLWMRGGAEVAAAAQQQETFSSRIGGQPVPIVRLSEASLA
jgi:hypothetical protein